MKKIILTCLLAIASSVWTMSKAFCMAAYTTNETVQTTMNGYLLMEGMPCEDGEPCANCLTFALETGNGLYYLVTEDEQIKNTLNALMMNELPKQATISGVPFKQGSFDYIQVYDITIGAYRLRHLCDEWNVLDSPIRLEARLEEVLQNLITIKYRITTDTVIEMKHCVKLCKENEYVGALYEESPSRIMFIPKGSTHAYLLYAFKAQVGDVLNNLWVECSSPEKFMSTYPNGWTMTVREIQESSPRTYVLSYTDSVCSYPYYNKSIVWLEGVGYPAGPLGSDAPFDFEIFTPDLLCAYANGEQVYVSMSGEQYGCDYSSENNADTIPLYIKDGPGSSTVEPVDPNEIVALLQKDQLSIYEYIDKELTLVLTIGTSNNLPARARQKTNDTFLHNMSVQLTEEGLYTIQLTNPEWDYIIEGKFMYPYDYQAIEATEVPVSLERKILRDGRLLIMHNSRLYTPMGTQVQ